MRRFGGTPVVMTGTAGVVRVPRRPPGWSAPGPAPRTPPDDLDVWPRAGEDLCGLAGDWRILQRLDGHRWSLDDLVTASVAATACADRPPARIADLGCGIGTVLLLLAWRFPRASCAGIEAQGISVDLARRSIAWNGVGDRCSVRLADLRDPASFAPDERFDLVTGTPPYLPPGTAVESAGVQRGPCRIERRGGIEDYCAAAARVLAPDGRFVTCASAEQPARVEAAARAANLAIVSACDVMPRAGKPPLFTVYVMQCTAASDGRRDLSPLVVRDHAGRRTEEMRALRAAMGMPP